MKVLKHPIKEPIKILNKFFRSKLNNYSKGIIPKVSKQNFLELDLEQKSTIKDIRKKIIQYLDEKFNGNENYKKIVNSSAFCSEKNNIVSDNYKITNNEKIGIIPPIGGG